MPGCPFGFGLLDPFLARRDKVPPDVPWPIHGSAAHNHQVRVGDSFERDAIAGAQHQKALASKPVAAYVDVAVEHINRALLVLGVKREHATGLDRDVGEECRGCGRNRRTLAMSEPTTTRT